MNRRHVLALPLPLALRRAGGGALAAALALPGALRAQATRTTRLVVGFPPGGAIDVVARLVAKGLEERLGTVVVDNRAGAGGRIAAETVKQAEPDGSTLLFAPAAVFAIYPHIHRNLRFDPAADFVPVGGLCQYPFAIAAGPASQAATLAALLQEARARPGALAYASPGLGTPQHFIGAGLARAGGVQMLHVPYRGGGEAMKDFLGGQVASMVAVAQVLVPQHRAGKARVLAVSSAARDPALPEVPTFAEAGFPGLTLDDWFALFAPAATPAPVRAELQEAATTLRASAAFAGELSRLGYQPMGDAATALPGRLQAEGRRWGELVAVANFTPTD